MVNSEVIFNIPSYCILLVLVSNTNVYYTFDLLSLRTRVGQIIKYVQHDNVDDW